MFSKMNGWFHRQFFLEDFFFGETFLGGHRKNYELLPVSMSFLWENDVKFPFGDFF